jgi:hypothetical protein
MCCLPLVATLATCVTVTSSSTPRAFAGRTKLLLLPDVFLFNRVDMDSDRGAFKGVHRSHRKTRKVSPAAVRPPSWRQ